MARKKAEGAEGNEGATKKKSRRRWLKRGALATVTLIVLYTLFGFFGIPAIIKHWTAPSISKRLVGDLTLARVTFNPYTFGLVIEGADVTDASGESVAGFMRFEGDLQLLETIFVSGWRFRHARLIEPSVHAELDADRSLNLASLMASGADAGASGGGASSSTPLRAIPRVVVGELVVTGASLRFRDSAFEPPIERAIEDLEFAVAGLDTEPSYDNPHELTASLGPDSTISWSGAARIDPLTAEGVLQIDGFDLITFSPYAEQFTGLAVEGGRLSLDFGYDMAPVRTDSRLVLNTERFGLDDVRITVDGRPLLNAKTLEVAGLRDEVDAGQMTVERVGLRGIEATLRRGPDGAFEVLSLLEEKMGSASQADETAGAQANRRDVQAIEYPLEQLLTGIRYLVEDAASERTIDIALIEITESAVRVIDESVSPPVDVMVSEITLQAGPIASADGFRAPIDLKASLPADGRIAISGVVDPLSSALELSIEGSNLAADQFAAYLPSEFPEPLDGASLRSAKLAIDGQLEANADETRMSASWDGTARVFDFSLARSNTTPVGFEALEATGALVGERSVASGAVDADWSGSVELMGLEVDVEVEGVPTTLALQGLQTEGAVQLQNADALEASWEGALSVAGLEATTEAQESPATLALGELQTTGTAAIGADGQPTWTGSVSVADLEATLVSEDAPALVGFSSLRMEDGEFASSDGGDFQADLLEVAGPRIEIARAAPREQESDAPEGAGESEAMRVRLGRLVVTDGAFNLEQRGTDPPVTITGDGLSVTAENIDTEGGTPTTLQVATRVADVGAVRVVGDVDPFIDIPFVDVEVGVTDMPLRPFSPAAEPQLGYTIDTGRLSLNLPIRIVEGKLDGQLDARLSSFYLGEKAPSETATKLPVKLGLDLLRDSNGDIDANIGLSGNVSDPSFSFGDLVWKAIFNLIGKIATAPFKIIGNLVGAGDDVDLSQVVFAPGTAELVPGSIDSLDLLARALRERPGLQLAVIGVTGPDDELPMKIAVLNGLLAEHGSVDGADDDETLRSLFMAQFPDEAGPRVPIPPGRVDQPTLSVEAMREKLLASIELPSDALDQLAETRAAFVVTTIVDQGEIDSQRVRAAPRADAQQAADIEPASVARFELLSSGR